MRRKISVLLLAMILAQFLLAPIALPNVYGDIIVDIEDAVDNDASDVDSSSDIGSSSNFTAQKYGPDSDFDTLSEEIQGGYAEDYVDVDTSDVDSSPDKGTHSNFGNEKASDSTYDTLTEIDYSTSEWLDVDGFDATYNQWLVVGTSPYLEAQDQPINYVYELKKGGDAVGWFDFQDTSFTSNALSVNISIYCNNDDGAGDDWAEVYVDYTGTGSGTYVGNIAQHTNWAYDTIDLGIHTAQEVNNLRVYFVYNKAGAGDDIRIDHAMIGVAEPTNYEVDLEVRFTSVSSPFEMTYLCIQTGATGAEDLGVNVWNGAGWDPLAADVNPNGWTNVSVTSYVNDTMTFRFLGGDESADSSPDTWEIDSVLLRNQDSYLLDLEVQWTGVDYSQPNEYLCINGGTMGAENIGVDVWYGSTWNNVLTDLDPGWNNITVGSYLDSSNFTIRFKGGTETSDATLDTWQIDTTLLHLWNYTYQRNTNETVEINAQPLLTHPRTILQTILIQATANRQLTHVRAISQPLEIIAQAMRSLGIARSISQPVIISSLAQSSTTFIETVEQTLGILTDTLYAWTARRLPSQIIQINAETTRTWTSVRLPSQPLQVLTQALRTWTMQRLSSQPLNLLTQAARQFTAIRISPQTLQILTQTARGRTATRLLSQTLSLSTLAHSTNSFFRDSTADATSPIKGREDFDGRQIHLPTTADPCSDHKILDKHQIIGTTIAGSGSDQLAADFR